MSSRIDNHWDRILAAPPPSLEELAADFPGYTFDTIGWGEDQEIVVTSLPPHMEARLPNVGTPSHPPLDLSTFTTPQRRLPVLDTAFTTRLDTSHGTPSPVVLKNFNSFPPFPPVDADRQNELPYVPGVTRARAADFATNRSRGLVIDDKLRSAIGNSGAKEGSDGKEKKRGRPRKEKENGEPDTSTKDDAKAKLKKKNDEDREGGESIRQASMSTLRKRARTPTSDDDTDRDIKNPSSRTTTAESSLETLNSDDDNASNAKKASKRRRHMRRSLSSDADGLLGLLKAENARRVVHDSRVAQSLEIFVSDSREQKKEFTSLLKELVANDRKGSNNS